MKTQFPVFVFNFFLFLLKSFKNQIIIIFFVFDFKTLEKDEKEGK